MESIPFLSSGQEHHNVEDTLFGDTGEGNGNSPAMVLHENDGDSSVGSDRSFGSSWASLMDDIEYDEESDMLGSKRSMASIAPGHGSIVNAGQPSPHGSVGEVAGGEVTRQPHGSEKDETPVQGHGGETPEGDSTDGLSLPKQGTGVFNDPFSPTNNHDITPIGKLDAKLDLILATIGMSSSPSDHTQTIDSLRLLLTTEKALSAKLAVDLEERRRLQLYYETTISELSARLSELEMGNELLEKDVRGLRTMMDQTKRAAQEEHVQLLAQATSLKDDLHAKVLAVEERDRKISGMALELQRLETVGRGLSVECGKLIHENSDLVQQKGRLVGQVRDLKELLASAGKNTTNAFDQKRSDELVPRADLLRHRDELARVQQELSHSKRQLELTTKRLDAEKALVKRRTEEAMKLREEIEAKRKIYHVVMDSNAVPQSECISKRSHDQVKKDLTTKRTTWEQKKGAYRASLTQMDQELEILWARFRSQSTSTSGAPAALTPSTRVRVRHFQARY